MQLQISQLTLHDNLARESTVETDARPYGAYSNPSSQSSPEKWQRFSHNPQVHDDAVRISRLQGNQHAASVTSLSINETFVPVSTGSGYRLLPIDHAVSRHPRNDDTGLDLMEATFGRNAIGYSEQRAFEMEARIYPVQIHANIDRPRPVTSPGARSTRINHARGQINANQRSLSALSRHAVAGPQALNVGYDGSIAADTGYEAEVLGLDRRTTSIHRRAHSECDNDEPLISFDE